MVKIHKIHFFPFIDNNTRHISYILATELYLISEIWLAYTDIFKNYQLNSVLLMLEYGFLYPGAMWIRMTGN